MLAPSLSEAALRNFAIPSIKYTLAENTNGLINKSYVVIDQDDVPSYFLQQIDHSVFKDIPSLMQNINIVCDFLSNSNDKTPHLELINNINGSAYHRAADGSYWRLYKYIPGNTHFRAESSSMAAAAGVAFGDFLKQLSYLNPNLVVETIPRFHDIELRFKQFREAHDLANAKRINKSRKLSDIIENYIHQMLNYYSLIKEKCTPTITHNDTKISNLLFTDGDKGNIVVDYDTLMPGYIPLDFGDSVRTICSTTVEDDLKLEETKYNLELFEAFSTSFVRRIFDKRNKEVLELLPPAACYMPFLMGLRMLTDYLNNDIYYSIKYPDHNLDRAANQFTLFMSGLSLQPEMNNIVEQAIK